MAISEKAIKAIIDIEQGFQRAQAIVDDMELRAWTVENKGGIMSEFEVSTEVTNNRTSVSLDNESDGVFINVVGRFIHEACEYIEVEGYDSLFPAFIPVDKWEAYRAEIDKAVAIYRVLRNKQS